MDEMVRVERAGAVGWVTVNRPEVRNALSEEACRRLTARIRELAGDRAVRVIVLRGAGDRVFISGADVREFREKLATPAAALAYDAVAEELSAAIEAAPKPVVAMINGHAVGSGCTVAMACDLRLASDRAKFGIPITRIGLCATVPDTARLTALVGAGRAKWLLMTGEIIPAEEALRIGLVDRVVPPDRLEAVTAELAGTLVRNAPLSMKAAKQMVQRCAGARGHSVAEGAPWYEEICRSRDLQEGIDAFFAKRQPAFVGE